MTGLPQTKRRNKKRHEYHETPPVTEFMIGSAVRIINTSQNGRIIAINGPRVTVRLSLDKDVPAVDWTTVDIGGIERVDEQPQTE